MKCRLRNLPLHAVIGALGSDHPFAEQHLRALHGALFDEGIVLHDEHFANVVGMIEKDDVVPADFVVCDVAILVGQQLEQCDRIYGTKLAPGKPQQVALEAVRDPCGYSACQLLSITDRNEASLLVSNLDHTDRDGSCPAATTASFTAGFGITHPSGARSGSIAVNYFCNRHDRLSLSCDGFSVNRLDVGLSDDGVLERLQESEAAHFRTPFNSHNVT